MATSHFCEDNFEKAETLMAGGNTARAQELYAKVIDYPLNKISDEDGDIIVEEVRAKEQAIYRMAEILSDSKNTDSLIQLFTQVRSFFSLLPKAKTTNMVRRLFDFIVRSGVPAKKQEEICREAIQWAREEKRSFLRHRLQLRLVEVMFEQKMYRESMSTLLGLLREVRRLDDRTLLLSIHLLESRIHYSVRNSSKARAALVSARTTANSIYCPPLVQAEMDLQSGVLHADEHDPKTAYSYFYEAFEGFYQARDDDRTAAQSARLALSYAIIAKIATDKPDELSSLLVSKHVLDYKGKDIDALKGIAEAYAKQDTHLFNKILEEEQQNMQVVATNSDGTPYRSLLSNDVIRRQLEDMYDTLVERHLLKIISSYNRVQLDYLASLLKLQCSVVESKVSQLILDKKLSGIVDQQHNCLIIFDDVNSTKEEEKQFFENAADEAAAEIAKSTLYEDALKALECYDGLVTALFDKASGKFDSLVEENLAKRALKSKTDDKKGKAGAQNDHAKTEKKADEGKDK